MLTLRANAKINLTLDILHKRPDGYHEVAMIMQAIDLADEVLLTARETGISVTADLPGLTCDADNLAHRAAALLQDTFAIRSGIHIQLVKRIPMAAGLAGGSTDAAAVLRGLNTFWDLRLSEAELCRLGAKLGSDVPFCLLGGTMLATGRGEILSRLPDMPQAYVVLAKLPISVSTAWVYQQYRAIKEHPDTAGMVEHLHTGNFAGIVASLGNVLESVTIAKYPEIAGLKQAMKQYGMCGSLMSGSGPTVFGITSDKEKAEHVAAKLKEVAKADIFLTKTIGK